MQTLRKLFYFRMFEVFIAGLIQKTGHLAHNFFGGLVFI